MSLDKSIALFGATGLVGCECLRLLLGDEGFSRVRIFTRRPLSVKPDGAADRPTLETHILDFEQIERHEKAFVVDQIVCALGTTIRKAGSRQEFRKVDFDYPLAIARIALAQGVRHFLLVSALGANAGSRWFYNRVKGELEAAILALPFRSHTVVRPSLLLGKRAEFRFGEKIAERLAFLMPETYKPVSAVAVAEALVASAREDRAGKRIIESAEIQTFAGRPSDSGPV
ncbi:MAG: NAD(P)H-binding protein [Nitrospira sp.]|nr:NAD(P)H-binding protein [Nitrospira sp.]